MFPIDLHKAFQELGPWITKFTVEGKEYGGHFDAMNDKRVDQFFQYFPNAQTILELGSLEGGHTFALSRQHGVKRVVAIEGRKANVDKARFVQKLFNIHNVEFMIENLENYDLSLLGTFDAVFCVGVLYHMPKPWDVIEQISKIGKNCFIWTHYAVEDDANKIVNGYKGVAYKEFSLVDPLSGMSPESFWPTLKDLKAMLLNHGFTRIKIIEDNPDHQFGPCVTMSAWREYVT